ncbi:type II CAAX prenyl endopeptidase Rce1 family protein [Agrilactobacillus yilanensis]|uniref:Type II CAAX prenyl endopeptidase Rce1 family protein n=1 Tax=Agrilactobacillus yilanensis TaxID=2485997 RepID=A0ABW4J2B7_9LACO|nr:CPBP family glutamic-type intramembrane protease [Agrilactobacillus yilanensis]
MEKAEKRHLPLAGMLLVLYGLLMFFEKTIILNKNVPPMFLLGLYLAAGLILAALAVNFYNMASHRVRPLMFKESLLQAPYYYVTLIFVVICGGLQLLTIWLQIKGYIGDFTLQGRIEKITGLRLWAFRMFYVALLPFIQQNLFNGVAFNELFTRKTAFSRFAGLLLVALLTGLFSGQAFGWVLLVQMVIGLLISLSYLLAKNIATPLLINIICNLIFVILYS